MRYAEHARIRQAQFRRTLPEAARTPTDALGLRHGHLLTLGAELHNLAPSIRGDDSVVPFFRARGIQWWTSSASGDVAAGKLEWSNYLAARYGGDIRPPDWSPATPPPLSWRRS